MCVIMVKRPTARIPLEHLHEGLTSNPDGWGIVVVKKSGKNKAGYFIHAKGMIDEIGRLEKLVEESQNELVAVHLRATSGSKVSRENCHPFQITEDVFMMHNGMIPSLGHGDSVHSDSWHLAENLKPFFQAYGQELAAAPEFQEWMKGFVGRANKVTFINRKGVVTINSDCGFERDGVWYSNWSAIPRR